MTDVNNNNVPGELRRDALEWIIRFTSGAVTEADRSALHDWCARSPAHGEAFAEALRLRRVLRLAAEEFVEEQRSAPTASTEPALVDRAAHFSFGRRAFLGGAIAASAAYLTLRPPLGLWPSLAELTAEHRTGIGERRELVVAAGLSVELNTRTSISVSSAQAAHEIRLVAGEAAVVLRPNQHPAPLTLIAGSGRTIASEATFNVRHDASAVRVTCLTGEVSVECNHANAVLQAGQQVSYGADGLAPSTPVDAAIASAWRRGLLIFRDVPLSEVVAEINRYRPGRIILANAQLERLLVNGTFHLNKIDGVIAQIAQLGARIRTFPGGVVLLS